MPSTHKRTCPRHSQFLRAKCDRPSQSSQNRESGQTSRVVPKKPSARIVECDAQETLCPDDDLEPREQIGIVATNQRQPGDRRDGAAFGSPFYLGPGVKEIC